MNDDTGVTVRVADESDLPAWQRFVDSTPNAACTHHAGWYRILRETSWVQPYFLVAENRSRSFVGILPLYHARSPLTGAYLSSLEDGVLAADPAAVSRLLNYARSLIDPNRARYLLIRGGAVDRPADRSFATVRTYIDTGQPHDALWSLVKKKTRWAVRQADKTSIHIERSTTLAELDDFYRIYAAHMRDLGTPVIGRDVFRAIRTYVGSAHLRLYLVKEREDLIGGMLCIVDAERWTDYFAIVRPTDATDFANYLLYWHVIRDASTCGVALLDLGRSMPDSNVQLFKRKWGGRAAEVTYH
jgi:CelD/BcsL family acetyltransferase involved in cellulose biosynthesis